MLPSLSHNIKMSSMPKFEGLSDENKRRLLIASFSSASFSERQIILTRATLNDEECEFIARILKIGHAISLFKVSKCRISSTGLAILAPALEESNIVEVIVSKSKCFMGLIKPFEKKH